MNAFIPSKHTVEFRRPLNSGGYVYTLRGRGVWRLPLPATSSWNGGLKKIWYSHFAVIRLQNFIINLQSYFHYAFDLHVFVHSCLEIRTVSFIPCYETNGMYYYSI